MTIDPRSATPRRRKSCSTPFATALITSNWTASPSGLRATPSSTIKSKTPALLASRSTNAAVMSGGLTKRMWIMREDRRGAMLRQAPQRSNALHEADCVGRRRLRRALKAGAFVHRDVARAPRAREQGDRLDLVRRLSLGEPKEPSTETLAREVRCDHEPPDVPCRALPSSPHSAHQSARHAHCPGHPFPERRPHVVEGFVQCSDVERVVGDGFVDPAAPLEHQELRGVV